MDQLLKSVAERAAYYLNSLQERAAAPSSCAPSDATATSANRVAATSSMALDGTRSTPCGKPAQPASIASSSARIQRGRARKAMPGI